MKLITAKRGIHVRPSKMLYMTIKDIQGEVFFTCKNIKRKITDICDILSMAIGEGDFLKVEILPTSKENIKKIYDRIDLINLYPFD